MNILSINGTPLTGIWVDAAVSFNKPSKRVQTFSVPGRNGDLVIDEGTFDNVLISYPVYEKATFPQEFDDIVNWLASLEGYQKIQCSNDPQHYRLGRFVVPVSPTAKRLNKDGYYTLSFDCKPQRWLLSGDEDTEIDQNPIDEYSGALISFEGTALDEITELKANITPVQNLNGQTSPYPAGGGKNLLRTTAQTTTINSVTFTVNADGTVSCSGTASGGYAQIIVGTISLEAGTYVISDGGVTGAGSNIELYISGVPAASTKVYTYKEFTLNSAISNAYVQFYIPSGVNASGKVLKPMICKSTATDPTVFAPYSNICPITGWSAAEVNRTGVNVWDEEWELGAYNISTGAPSASTTTIRNKNRIPVVASQNYYFLLTNATTVYGLCYDVNGAFLGLAARTSNQSSNIANAEFHLKDGTVYLNWYSSNYGTTYNNDISINYPSTDTAYHAYLGTTHLIDWGINRWDEEWESGVYDTATGAPSSNSSYIRSKQAINCGGNEKYYACVPSGKTITILFWNGATYMGQSTRLQLLNGGVFTAPSGATTMKFYINIASYANDISVNYPSTYTDYHKRADPYIGTVFGGKVDALRGKIVCDWASITLVGGNEATYAANGTDSTTSKCMVSGFGKANGMENFISDTFWKQTGTAVYNIVGRAANGNVEFSLPASVPNTVSDLKAWFAANPTQLVYELATPIEVDITAVEIAPLVGDNNIWADCGDVEVEVTTPTVFVNPSNFNSKPLIRVYGAGDFKVNDLTVTIAAHDKPYIDIDCEAQECYYEGESMASYVTFSGNDFPELVPGNNYLLLASGITKLDVTPRWWIL